MADDKVPAKDLKLAFKRLKSSAATNKTCFDCRASNPTWASVTYGIFLCIDCSAVHRSLGVHLTFIRSIQLDTNWTWLQLRAMQVGGNAKANAFFRQHNLLTKDAAAKYKSRVASMYKEKIALLAQKACEQYGTNLHIDTHHNAPATPEEKEADFFSESHHANDVSPVRPIKDVGNDSQNGNGNDVDNGISIASSANTVDEKDLDVSSLSISPPKSATKEARVPTIGGRKPAAKKAGIKGAKKKGLGATKVASNFAEIESEAQQLDKMKENINKEDSSSAASAASSDVQLTSSSFQYKTASMIKEEEKLKQLDPKKAAQMQRLGMGLAGHRSGIGHSASDSMNTVEQVGGEKESFYDKDRYSSTSSSGFFDTYGMDDSSSPYMTEQPPKYDSGFGGRSSSSYGSKDYRTYDRSYEDSRSRPTKKESIEPPSEDMQKKFGSAKAISSRDVFGDSREDDMSRDRLGQYQGSSAISSADLFGEDKKNTGRSVRSVDYSQLKAGVSQVTGKLSNMASGVIGSLQSRYSGSN
eukprot:gene13014-14354_t